MILVVEDEPVTRNVLVWALNQSGYTVLAAEDGAQALAISRARRSDVFGVLITDIYLPGMSGIELAAELRRDRPELRIIYVSGMSQERFATLGAGMTRSIFLAKPFDARQLAGALRALSEL